MKVLSIKEPFATLINNKKKYIETKYGGEIIFLEVDGKDISSTYIRELINKNLHIEKFLSKGVLNIVKQKELYK